LPSKLMILKPQKLFIYITVTLDRQTVNVYLKNFFVNVGFASDFCLI